jgi:hypothetical protein
MDFEMVMQELESLGKERTKKIKKNQPLAEQLYTTGNYDAMYFAGVIADPKAMIEADFERWMDSAYFYMLSDYVVAVTLAETDIAQEVADQWIASGEELRMSAGWSCYCWLLGNRPDGEFSESKLAHMLIHVMVTIDRWI